MDSYDRKKEGKKATDKRGTGDKDREKEAKKLNYEWKPTIGCVPGPQAAEHAPMLQEV